MVGVGTCKCESCKEYSIFKGANVIIGWWDFFTDGSDDGSALGCDDG